MSLHTKESGNFISHAADIASFYGFRPMREVELTVPPKERQKGVHNFTSTTNTCAQCIVQKKEVPVLAFYASASPAHIPASITPAGTAEFGLHVAGSPESLGEVVLLKTLFAIMQEWGTPVARVRINALGDRDSKARFERELSSYLRKHTHSLDLSCRERALANPASLYTCPNETCREVLADGPRAMNFLSEKSRSHFKQVLEHIERLGLPYELDDLLAGDERDPRLLFALDMEKEDDTVLGSVGGRYDEYMRKLTGKKDGAGVHASIFFRKKGLDRSHFSIPAATPAPKVYFIQLGLRAKLQGLQVVDMLRRAHIPVSQSFSATSLAPQLASAQQLGVSHLLIIGQREALDGTIIVRSTKNSSQSVVQLAALPRFLKSIH